LKTITIKLAKVILGFLKDPEILRKSTLEASLKITVIIQLA
jgi:hypothetical protein